MNQQQDVTGAEYIEPPRIKKFRMGLAQAIPCFPNDRSSRIHLKQKRLRGLLVDFINWRSRYVGARPRNVNVESTAIGDPRWVSLSIEISDLLDKARKGEDLTPYLSLKPHTRGFTPAALARGASVDDKWSDKDFVLAAQGFHHFHIGISRLEGGYVERTDDLLFAYVTRDSFDAVAIFDHSVFDPASPERHRLWTVHDRYVYRSAPPGSVVIGASISTSGHTTQVVLYANKCARIIVETDRKLDDHSYIEKMREITGKAIPPKPKFVWGFNHLDLGIHETKSRTFFTLIHGWN